MFVPAKTFFVVMFVSEKTFFFFVRNLEISVQISPHLQLHYVHYKLIPTYSVALDVPIPRAAYIAAMRAAVPGREAEAAAAARHDAGASS